MGCAGVDQDLRLLEQQELKKYAGGGINLSPPRMVECERVIFMTPAIKQFVLDMDQQSILEYVHVREGDTARGFCVTLMGSGIPYEIEDGSTAEIFAALPDGTYMTDDCTISGNQVSYMIPGAMTSHPGAVECNIKLSKDTAALYSPEFLIVVDEINADA